MKYIFIILFISIVTQNIICQLNVMSPYDLTQRLRQLFPSVGSKIILFKNIFLILI